MQRLVACGLLAMALPAHARARPHVQRPPSTEAAPLEAQSTDAAPSEAQSPQPPTAPPGEGEGVGPSDARDVHSDTPPPSSWDLYGHKDDHPSFVPSSRSLTEQMFRTLAALVGVIALLYALAKLVLPKVLRGAQNKSSSLEVLERLNLDGRNTLVVVGTQQGGRFVLGCSENHVTLIERTPAGGAFVADEAGILRPQPGATEFGDHLGPAKDGSSKGARR